MTRRVALLLGLALAPACVSTRPEPSPTTDRGPVFELNFAGVTARDWPAEFRFYTESLGLRAHSRDGHWALFGAGWDDYVLGRSRALAVELFERVPATAGPSSEPDQALRLGLRVDDLDAARAAAESRGVRFIAPGETARDPRRVDFTTPAGTRWFFYSTPPSAGQRSRGEPEVLRVEMHVADLPRQLVFYRDVLGMHSTEASSSGAILGHEPDGPQLVLQPGGLRGPKPGVIPEQAALAQPVFLGFMTADVRAAAAQLRNRGISLIAEVQHHDWGGTDLLVADADGNVIQIFEFDEARRFGAERP